MPFLALINANIKFNAKSLTERSYSVDEVLPTTKQVELIIKHKFAKAALDENFEMFVMHIAVLRAYDSTIHSS